MTASRSIPLGGVCLLALLQTVGAQNAALPGDWPMYRRDAAGTGHSPLAEITTANVARLARSWTVPPPDGGGAERQLAGDADRDRGRDVRPCRGSGRRARCGDRHREMASRGERRHAVAAGRRLLARRGRHRRAHRVHRRPPADRIDAASGALSTGFGTNGEVDLGHSV